MLKINCIKTNENDNVLSTFEYLLWNMSNMREMPLITHIRGEYSFVSNVILFFNFLWIREHIFERSCLLKYRWIDSSFWGHCRIRSLNLKQWATQIIINLNESSFNEFFYKYRRRFKRMCQLNSSYIKMKAAVFFIVLLALFVSLPNQPKEIQCY